MFNSKLYVPGFCCCCSETFFLLSCIIEGLPCALEGCTDNCGAASKTIRALQGCYELKEIFTTLNHNEIEKLKVCNFHYNRDRCRHQKIRTECKSMCITDLTCRICNKKIKTNKSFPCPKHVVQINNGKPFLCGVSCIFFSEYIIENEATQDNEDFYHQCDTPSEISAYLCMNCNKPLLEMEKNKRKYELSQKRLKILLEGAPTTAKKQLKAHQFKVKEVFEEILEETKKEEDIVVSIVKNSLMLSQNMPLSGEVTDNKKLVINFLKDSVIAKYEVIGKTVKRDYILKPQLSMTMDSLTRSIFLAFENLQSMSICLGIYEDHWVSACQRYNVNNEYKGKKYMFHIDHSHILPRPKQTAFIKGTVRSSAQNGQECQTVVASCKSEREACISQRCEPCKRLLRHCIRKLPRVFVKHDLEEERTSPNSKTPLTTLGNEELLRRCKRMREIIVKLKRSNNKLSKLYEQEMKKENLITMPENVLLTSGKLGSLMDVALSKNILQENSVLYALLCDTVSSLIKAESEHNNTSTQGKKRRPKGMRFNPIVLKWCVNLAGKCGQGGYNLIREILPVPSLVTVNSYRQCEKSYKVVSQENLKMFSQELTRRNCKGIGGIHWDEIYIKKGIKVCARTNQLVGFEDLDIPNYIEEEINVEDEGPNHSNADGISQRESDGEYSTDTCDDTDDGELFQASDRPTAKIILQFFWSSIEGDFTWPVASFPIHNINSKTLGNCVWKTISIVSDITFGKLSERKVQVLYGVCDGATHSSAFFNQYGTTNWMTENPYNNNNNIFWLSDPPHMIKKLRNFLISPNRDLSYSNFKISLEHLTDVAERGLTKLSSKHLFLNSRTKMSVKRAAETCCREVADDILYNSRYGYQETLMTRHYIRKVTDYFKIMNSISVEADTIHRLVKVLVFFKRWFTEISNAVKDRKGALREHWKKFISKHTYYDLTRSIRGFIGLISYLKTNHPDILIVPRTTNQDDVENYFSLQRARIAGGEPTVQQYMDGNSSLATHLLVKAEKEDLNVGAYVGSYASLVTPNFVSVPLKRRKTNIHKKLSNNNYHVSKSDENIGKCCFSINENEVDKFHTQKDEQQLYRQAEQVLDHITVKSSSTIIGYTLKLVNVLREKPNKHLFLHFLKRFNFKLRKQHFVSGKWHVNSLNNALTAIYQDKDLEESWQLLLHKVNLAHHNSSVDDESNKILVVFCKKFCKRRCVTFLAVDQLNPKHEEQNSAIRQMLRSFEKEQVQKQVIKNVKSTDKCFKCGEHGHWAVQCTKKVPHDPAWLEKQQCYTCGQIGHLKKDCKTTESKALGTKGTKHTFNSKNEVRKFDTWYDISLPLTTI